MFNTYSTKKGFSDPVRILKFQVWYTCQTILLLSLLKEGGGDPRLKVGPLSKNKINFGG